MRLHELGRSKDKVRRVVVSTLHILRWNKRSFAGRSLKFLLLRAISFWWNSGWFVFFFDVCIIIESISIDADLLISWPHVCLQYSHFVVVHRFDIPMKLYRYHLVWRELRGVIRLLQHQHRGMDWWLSPTPQAVETPVEMSLDESQDTIDTVWYSATTTAKWCFFSINFQRFSTPVFRDWQPYIPLSRSPTLQGINISYLGKRKIIFKSAFLWDMLVPRRVLIATLMF